MLGLVDRGLHELGGMLVGQPVEDLLAFLAGGHDGRLPQPGQVLGGGGRRLVQPPGQLGHLAQLG